MIRRISSSDNPAIKKIIQLSRKKHRELTGEYIAEGRNSASEALINKIQIEDLVISDEFLRENEENKNLVEKLEIGAKSTILVPHALFRKLTDSETPPGILITVKKPVYEKTVFYKGSNYIVLDRLQDPGNIGTILRTADAAGYSGVIAVKGTADIFSPKIVRAAAGSLFRMPVRFIENAEDTLAELREYNKKIICTSPHTDTLYYEADISADTAVIIGNEAGGAGSEFIQNSDVLVRIPMYGNIESLNAAVAAAIIMYESVRQNPDRK